MVNKLGLELQRKKGVDVKTSIIISSLIKLMFDCHTRKLHCLRVDNNICFSNLNLNLDRCM